jgi:biopolymer transport protein ExbB
MFLAADWVVQGVMIGLAAASVLVWILWLTKWLGLIGVGRRLRRARGAIKGATALKEAQSRLKARGHLAAAMLTAALDERALTGRHGGTSERERIATRLLNIEDEAVRRWRAGLAFLATVRATAPFVGLFGTVWGIMNSFVGIAKTQTTNLAVVAPGIAEALLATAIGLFAAIPAVVLYNLLSRRIATLRRETRLIRHEIERIAARELDHATMALAVRPVVTAAE